MRRAPSQVLKKWVKAELYKAAFFSLHVDLGFLSRLSVYLKLSLLADHSLLMEIVCLGWVLTEFTILN